MKIVWFLTGLIAVGAVAGLAVIYSGLYNVAATTPHFTSTEWVMETTMERSVARHAKDVIVPDLSSEEMLAEGIPHFDEMCVSCHGAPDKEPDYVGKGLNPEAPDLAEEAEEWSEAELFWITKHGVKMTGMPAFGVTHDDEELWPIVAAMKRLPDLSPEAYAQMVEGHHHDGETSNNGEHEHAENESHEH